MRIVQERRCSSPSRSQHRYSLCPGGTDKASQCRLAIYVALKVHFAAPDRGHRGGGHINADVTLRIRRPPWVRDSEALIGPRMEDSRSWKEIIGKRRDPFPVRLILLTAGWPSYT